MVEVQFTKVFKGFYESNGKKPKLKLNEIDMKVVTYEQAKHFDSFVGYLAPGYVLIDIDNKLPGGEYDTNKTESKILIEILDRLGITTPILETDHGHHFFFHTTDKTIIANTEVTTPIGVTVDYKTGEKNGASCFKLGGVERTLYLDCKEIAELPLFLKYNKRLEKKLEELKNGIADNGRNNFLSSYKFLLLKNGYLEKEVYRILELINDYILYEPLEHKELGIIMRQESIEVSKPTSYYGEDGKIDTHLVAKSIVKEFQLINVDGAIYSYTGKSYHYFGMDYIERIIYDRLPKISVNKWKEIKLKTFYEAPQKKRDVGYLSLKNGLLKIEEENIEVIPHSKDVVTTFYIDINYNPKANLIPITAYLLDLVSLDMERYFVLMEYIGYALHPRNFTKKILLIKGEKNNGKSKFFEILTYFFGVENCCFLDMKQMNERFGLAPILGKTINIGDDISDQYISEDSILKKLGSGEIFMIELKGKDLIVYSQNCKMFFACNEAPRFKDPTGAIATRMLIIPFENTYSVENNNLDVNIVKKMTSPENMEALLFLAIDGLKRLLKNQEFTHSEKIKNCVEEFTKDNNPVKLFIEEELGETKEEIKRAIHNKPIREVYSMYSYFCLHNGYKTLSDRIFGKQFRRICPYVRVSFTKNAERKTLRIYQI